jgi:hypothetical protein
MRYSKAVLLQLVAVFLLIAVVPASAWDGKGHWTNVVEIEYDHPWQDENQDPGSISRVLPPIVVTPMTISFEFNLPSWLTCLFIGERPVTPVNPAKATPIKLRRAGNDGRIQVSRRDDLR